MASRAAIDFLSELRTRGLVIQDYYESGIVLDVFDEFNKWNVDELNNLKRLELGYCQSGEERNTITEEIKKWAGRWVEGRKEQ